MGLQSIFPTHIYTHFVPQNIADKMEEIIIPKLKGLENFDTLHTDFYKSEKIISTKEITPFLNYLNLVVDVYSQESNIKYKNLASYWTQDYQTNQHHEIHCHPTSTISGTYYIRSNQHAGELTFYNPNQHVYMEVPKNFENSNHDFKIKPQKGLLILFPSWLKHEIFPSQEKDVVRTSFSFNYEL